VASENSEYWDRQKECPGCRSTDKIRSEIEITGALNICDRCGLMWISDEPIEEEGEAK
jgi:hypothetical protein